MSYYQENFIGAGGSLTINTTPITGATGAILWDDTGFLQEVTIGSGLTFSGGTLTATGTGNPSPPVNSVQYDNAGAFGGAANFSISGGLPNVPSAMSYLCNNQNALYVVPNIAGDNWFEGGAGNTTLTGGGNFGTGQSALSSLTNGQNNAALGNLALQSLTSGQQNTAFGDGALQNATTALGNTAIGFQALQSVTTGQNNFAMGKFALQSITTDGGHVGIGGGVMTHLTTSAANMAIGGLALGNNVTGGSNVAIGTGALQGIVTGTQNVGIGDSTCAINDTSNNTLIGYGAGSFLVANNNNNTLIGWQCGQRAQGSNNTWIGGYNVNLPGITSTITLATGGTLQLDFGITAAGWTFASLNTPGLMTTNASGTVAIANSAPAAAVPASFSATNRIQVNIGGTTYYIPADTVAW
jgi:hypothetical protein